MRINLSSAVLLSGTVLLLSSIGAIADTTDAEKTSASKPTSAQQSAPEMPTAEITPAETEASAAPPANTKAPGTTDAKAKEATAPGAAAETAASKGMIGPTGGNFRFGPEAEKEAIVDPAEAVEKARQLHAKAMEQAKAKDLAGAKATEQLAITAAPHYWLPHAGLVYLMMTEKKRPMDALKEASMSIYGKHNAVAERNCAKLFEMIHWYPPAQKALTAAIKMEPESWETKLGLADLYLAQGNGVEAKGVLDRIKPEALVTYPAISVIAAHYLTVDDFPKARLFYEKALAVAPDDSAKKECNDRLFIIAVKSGDTDLMKKTLPLISEQLKTSRPELVLQARARMATAPAEFDAVLKEAANVQTRFPGDVFFTVGKEVFNRAEAMTAPAAGSDQQAERTALLKQADSAFKNAISRDQQALLYRVADITALDEMRNYAEEQQAYTAFKESIPPGSETLKLADVAPPEVARKMNDYAAYNAVKAFEPQKDITNGAFKSNARELQYQVMKSSCSCHARGMRKGLMQEPGVIFTYASKDDKPTITVIYDGRINNAKKLMASKVIENYHDPVEQRSDKPIDSFKQLSLVILDRDEQRPAVALKHDYALEVPMDNAGQVAQNTPTTESNVH